MSWGIPAQRITMAGPRTGAKSPAAAFCDRAASFHKSVTSKTIRVIATAITLSAQVYAMGIIATSLQPDSALPPD